MTAWKQYEIRQGKTMNHDTAGINLKWVIPKITPKSVSKVTLTSPPMETQTNVDSLHHHVKKKMQQHLEV